MFLRSIYAIGTSELLDAQLTIRSYCFGSGVVLELVLLAETIQRAFPFGWSAQDSSSSV